MDTNITDNNDAALTNCSNKHNVSGTVHNQYIMIFEQKKIAIISTNWYFDLLEGF